MFDEIAPSYDFLNRLLTLGRDVVWRAAAADAAVDGNQNRVLDVCCGTGDLAGMLARRGTRAIGADFSLPMLRIAARRRVCVLAADALRLPFPNGSFDGCAVAFGLRNAADPAEALREMARVVRPGGRGVVLEFTRPRNPVVRFYVECVLPLVGDLLSASRSRAYTYLPRSIGAWKTPRELEALMRGAGFVEVSSRALFPGVAVLHRGRIPG